MAQTYDNAQITRELGVYVQPGIGEAYPELVADLKDLYRNRVSRLPFVPASWLGRVLDLMGDTVVVKVQHSLPKGVPFNGIPDWITGDAAARTAWEEVAKLVDDAVYQFAYKQVEAGRAVLADAEANAAFWDSLYQTAVAIRDLPGTAVDAVGRGVASTLGAFLKKAWWVVLIVVVLAFAWMNRAHLLAAANRRVRKAVV